jgi:hypothetical protein
MTFWPSLHALFNFVTLYHETAVLARGILKKFWGRGWVYYLVVSRLYFRYGQGEKNGRIISLTMPAELIKLA